MTGVDAAAGSTPEGDQFIGRAWLGQAVQDWAESDVRYLVVTGSPGAGKSATVNHLWSSDEPVTGDTGLAVYRCRALDRRSCDPVRFAESVAEQFSRTIPGFTDALMRVSTELSGRSGDIHIEGSASAGTVHPQGLVVGVSLTIANVSADEAFERLVGRPLARLAPQRTPVVVIDALDEALTYRGHRTIAELVLGGAGDLPLRFVVTSRHDDRVVSARQRMTDTRFLDLVTDAPDAEEDLAEYARHRLLDLVPDKGEREEHARRLARLGAGSYLFVYHLTAELIAGRRDLAHLGDVGTLPTGLEDLYRQFLRREIRPLGNVDGEERWSRQFRPVLELLVVAQGAGFSSRQLAGMLDRSEQSVLDVVRVLRQYLFEATGGLWTLYHRSFAEFLLRGRDAPLDAADGHRRIADHAFAEWSENWTACDDGYYVQHLAHHLMSALEGGRGPGVRAGKQRSQLYSLATSETFLAAQQDADPGRDRHLTTIALALEATLGANEFERVAALSVALVRAQADADSVTPVQAALDFGADAGFAKARSYPEEMSLLWHLLILVALGRRDPGDADPVATVIARSGFGTVARGWEVPFAMLLAPFFPVLAGEQARAVLDVSDDGLLSYLSLFLLEGVAPDLAIAPALRIREDVLRGRAFTEIVSRLTLTGGHGKALRQAGEMIMADFAARECARVLGGEGDGTSWKSYLVPPEVPESVLLAEAARGHFAEARDQLTAEGSPYRRSIDFYAVLRGMVVNAVLNGGAAGREVTEAGETEISREPGYVWALLPYSAYLRLVGDPRVPVLLDRIVKLSHGDDPDAFLWELHQGHIDAFHGRCDVGLRHAVVQALCAEGRAVEAASEAERLRNSPVEYVRALSYVHAAQSATEAASTLAAARSAAVESGDLAAQAMLVLLDGNGDQLLAAVSEKLERAEGGALRLASTSWSLLAWAAGRRGYPAGVEQFAGRAVAAFSALPQDVRPARVQARLVCNLLRAGSPAAARAVLDLPVSHLGSRVLLFGSDPEHALLMSAELDAVRALRRELGCPSDPEPDTSFDGLSVTIRYLRAVGDADALNRALAIARENLDQAIADMSQDVQERHFPYHDSFEDEARAVRLALHAADLGDVEAAKSAVQMAYEWAWKAESASMAWDAFRGHYPRDEEWKSESDARNTRRSQALAYVAEAHYRTGNADAAREAYAEALDFAAAVLESTSRSLAFVALAEVVARCGWYSDLAELRPELTRIRGSGFGSVAEILVVTALQGGPGAVLARETFLGILRDESFVNVDCADILALLAVLSGDSGVEARLLDAADVT